MGWQDEMETKAEEFVKEFGLSYLQYYGLSLVLKVKKETPTAAPSPNRRKLNCRVWDSVPKPAGGLMQGWVAFQTGEGVSSFGGWQWKYLKEQNDYNLGVYGSETDSKPGSIISLAGYTLVSDVNAHFKKEAKTLASQLDCDEPDVDFSRFSWALVHPVRDNYVFQLHKGVSKGCACFPGGGGGDKEEGAENKEDEGAEHAEMRAQWITWMEQNIPKTSPRNITTDVLGMTFERTWRKMAVSIPELKGFKSDGTEGQILADMMFIAIFEAACKTAVMEEIKELPPSPIFRVGAWHKGRGLAAKLFVKMADAAWSAGQKQAHKLNDKIEPEIRKGIVFILEKKAELQNVIKDKTSGQLGSVLAKYVSPFVQPVFQILDMPFKEGFKIVRSVFEEHSKRILTNSEFVLTVQAKSELAEVARTPVFVVNLSGAARKVLDPLRKLMNSEAEVFQDLRPDNVVAEAERLMLEALDACFYTMQANMDPFAPPPPKSGEAAAPIPEPMKYEDAVKDVIQKLEHDSMVLRATWMKTTISSTLITCFKRFTDPHVGPLINELQDNIPSELKEILDIRAEYDAFVDSFIAEPINKVVDAAYPIKG